MQLSTISLGYCLSSHSFIHHSQRDHPAGNPRVLYSVYSCHCLGLPVFSHLLGISTWSPQVSQCWCCVRLGSEPQLWMTLGKSLSFFED
jgi:hypothetical protein